MPIHVRTYAQDNFNDFKFEIAEGAEYFKVGGADGNELIALFSADYENKKEYTVKVRCVDTSHQDGDSNELVEEFIIGVIDENDVAPYDIVFDHDAFVETTKSGDVIATLSFKDDDTVETHYTLALSGEHSGYFTLTGDGGKTGELKLVNALDYDTAVDHVYALSISVDDHRTGADPSTQSFTFAVTDANDIAPSACHWESVPFAEGVSGVTVIAGVFSYEDADTSKDDNTLTFTDASGKFHFDPVTGTINVASSVDFETDSSYPVQIKVNDHANTELVCDFSISPDDVNDNAPEAFVISEGTLEISAKTIEVDLAENTAVGSVVYRLDFSDEDTQSSGQVFTCHVDDETNTFGLDKTESVSDSFFELMLEGEVDYETTKDYSFDMTVSDGSYTEVFRVSVKVKDENDVAPSDITLSAYAVAETAAVGTEAATITFDDVDTVGDYTCTIPSTDPFTISAADDNTFILLTAEDFNHHVSSSYTISITCSDGVHSETDTAVITIEDKNDNAPSALALSSEDIDENKAVGSTVGLLSFEDQDGETPNEFTFTVTNVDIVGDDTVFFTVGEITATSGSHTFTAPLLSAQEFDFEEKSLYPINIKISDGKHFHDQEFTVTVTDLNDNEMGEVSVTQNEAAAVSVVSE